jgi:hypothetical protein
VGLYFSCSEEPGTSKLGCVSNVRRVLGTLKEPWIAKIKFGEK